MRGYERLKEHPNNETPRLIKALVHKGFSGMQKPKTDSLPKSLPILLIKKTRYSYGNTDYSPRIVRFLCPVFESEKLKVFCPI